MSARNDRRTFVERLAHEAEQAAAWGELSMVYKITKQLSGQKKIKKNKYIYSSIPVKDKQSKLITTEKEHAARWVYNTQKKYSTVRNQMSHLIQP